MILLSFVLQYKKLRKPYIINDLEMQFDIQVKMAFSTVHLLAHRGIGKSCHLNVNNQILFRACSIKLFKCKLQRNGRKLKNLSDSCED